MKNIQKISKFLLSTVALLVPVLSVSASYDKTKDISTESQAGLHARNRPEARLRKERNDLATLTEGREQLAGNVRDLGEERFEIEKERVAKLALLSEEKISQNPEVPEFKSKLFKKGKLIYSDDFDGELNREFWGQSKGKKMEDGKLIIGPLFQSKEEAMKALKRDHHLGLEPVAHINLIPEKFVMHLRYQFAKPDLTPGRPSFQIGHHMIHLAIVKEGGHRVKLLDGPSFFEPESGMALNKWIDLVVEYELGKIRVLVNGHGNTYEHEKVTIINPKANGKHRFTFKGGSECIILFDSVWLWDCR
ncbi:MAG: hypothetical protein P8P49_01595 [Opitutales bacterium]|nr:hypothetical protein [Opitutales bacterium]